jgi:group II intron reverse transcriptase/maturase
MLTVCLLLPSRFDLDKLLFVVFEPRHRQAIPFGIVAFCLKLFKEALQTLIDLLNLLFRCPWLRWILKGFKRCRKARSKVVTGNGEDLSWNESKMSDGDYDHEKSLRATPSMTKFMNLFYSPTILPWIMILNTLLYLLMDHVVHGILPESCESLYAIVLGHFHPKNGLQGSKLGIGMSNGNWGLPKGRKAYGNRDAILAKETNFSEGRQAHSRSKKAYIISEEECVKLFELRNHAAKVVNFGCSYNNLIHIIGDYQTLLLAYELLKSKPGNMTKGPTSETLDGIDRTFLLKTATKLKEGKFKFSPSRRIWIPKPGKKEKRPLAIASPREKVVQKAMELVLSAIYEPSFLDNSHGFRPNRSPHSALKMIDETFKGVVWFIEADVTKCFDSFNHDKLLEILSKRIKCQKTLALIRSSLKAGYVELGGIAEKALLGTPQGSVLSPLLCNVYMHEFDLFMNKLMMEEKKGTRRRQNPAYTKVLNLALKANTLEEKVKIRRHGLRQHPMGDPMDPNYVRVQYVRFADDFLISVIGSKALTVNIKERVANFLSSELDLILHKDKTLLTKASKGPAFFLGTEIQQPNRTTKKVVLTAGKIKARVTARISMKAPVQKLIKKLMLRGFVKWNENGTILKSTAIKRMVNLDHADIVNYYNMVVRGILNFYSHVDNRSSLGSLVRSLHMSCALTLALKYKLRRKALVFKKFKSALTCPDTGVGLFFPNTLQRIRRFNVKAANMASLEKSWAGKLTRSNIGKVCIVCGAENPQMHHVRSIKSLKTRKLDWFTMQMAAINRKQVPLCAEHHQKLHANRLSVAEREMFVVGCKTLTANKPPVRR